MADDFDIVSDLNDGADTTVSAHESTNAVHGDDAVNVNNRAPVREPVQQPKKVGTEPANDGTATDKPLSLRDQISSALKGETHTPPAATQDGAVRDPITGQFVPKVVDAAAIDPNAPPIVAAPVTAAPMGIDPQVFASLPAETQAHLARTMEDVNTRQQRFARLEPIEQLIAPRRDAWALNGMSEATALNQLLALSDFAGRDMPGFLKYMANENGVKLEDLVFEAEPVDPQIAELQREIHALKNGRLQDTQQQQRAVHEQTVSSITAFASEAGQDGKPLRPYFGELGSDVLPFISAVKAANPNWSNTQVLQEAYDRACWGTPSVRSKMQAAADAAGQAERLRLGAEKVDRARTASASVGSGAPTSVSAAPVNGSLNLRDTIKATMTALS